MSSLDTWQTDSLWDLEYTIQRVLRSLPWAAPPEELLHGAGLAVLCKTGQGDNTMVLMRSDHIRKASDLFAALDTNNNSYLDRAEWWRFQSYVKYWLPNGHALAWHASTWPRDAQERVTMDSFSNFLFYELPINYQDFIVVNVSTNWVENDDEEAFRYEHDYANYLPLGRIQAVSTTYSLPIVGAAICAFASEPLYFFWDLLYTCLAAPGMCFLCYKLVLRLGYDVHKSVSNGLCLVVVSVVWVSYNPILFLCVFLYVSVEIGKLITLLLLLSMDDYRRFLAHLEYRMDRDDAEEEQNTVEVSLAAWASDVRFVRCPLCRRLSTINQVVRRVHADIRRDSCCVCLATPSEVCFGCGHLCMCSNCFDGLLEQPEPTPEDDSIDAPPTVFGTGRNLPAWNELY